MGDTTTITRSISKEATEALNELSKCIVDIIGVFFSVNVNKLSIYDDITSGYSNEGQSMNHL